MLSSRSFVRTLVFAGATAALLAPEALADGRGRPHAPPVRPAYSWGVGFGWGYPSPWFWPGLGYYPAGLWPAYAWAYPYPWAVAADPSASIRVQVKPAQTEVFVDGRYAGVADEFDGLFQRLQVAPGEHTLELYLEGYRSARQDLHIESGESYKIRHEMEPLAPGEEAPPRPAPIAAEPATEASAPRGAAPERRAGSVEDFGVLVLHARPGEVEVTIDGERWPVSEGALTVHLAAGPHRLELRCPGYEPFAAQVEIEPGQESPLNVMLTPAKGGAL